MRGPASAAAAREAANSALASGFRTVVLMGERSEGEDELRMLAGELDGRGGARVVYVKEQEVKAAVMRIRFLTAKR